MEVILLERISRLGQMGDTVRVRDGFARNFLLPQGKALRATEANKKRFESQRSQLEARNLELKREAEVVGEKLNGKSFIVVRQAGDYLHLMQTYSAGPLYTTTVLARETTEGRLMAVHTRHEYTDVAIPGFTSRPEMYLGECAAK